jgi:hypothetical protein
MAKPKQKVVKTPKKVSTKYGKLAAVCAKELSAKKAALVRAEKAFAKAQKTHTELLAEVARLDMLDRSLKALINGTEPPQNVRYVYTYPQWVWHGNPYGWWWNGYTWTLGGQNTPNYTIYNTQGNLQGGQFTTNAINTVQTTTAGSLLTSGSNLSMSNVNAGSISSGYDSSAFTLSSTASASAPSVSFTTSNASGVLPELTVDLSTGAAEDDHLNSESTEVEPEVETVGHGG